MSKKSGGLGALLFGAVMGAAAVFLSKKENRDKTKKVITKAASKAQKIRADYQKNPTKVKKELQAQGQKMAQKALAEAKKSAAQLKRKADKARKTAKK